MSELFCELSKGGYTVRAGYGSGRVDGPRLSLSDEGIVGWWGTPDLKLDLSERQTGDGAHDVASGRVLYGARTVTVNLWAEGRSREECMRAVQMLGRMAHGTARLRVVDGGTDTWAEGAVSVETRETRSQLKRAVAVTVVCPDARRLSTAVRRIQLMPTSSGSGGLFYGSSGAGLSFPLSYGAHAEDARNVGTMRNDGTSAAYPVITVTGPMNGGFRIDCGGGSVAYSEPVGAVPLVLDCRRRSASIAGLDVSDRLTSRGFPTVPAGGSASISLQASGTGWATVEWHDTYI